MNKLKVGNYFELHFIVILLGFTAILGKLIQLPAPILVWYRTLFAFAALFVWLIISRTSFVIPLKKTIQLLGIGLIVGAHWIFFFHAIKVSNVTVTLGCLASGTLFASFLEPLFLRRRIYWFEVLIGVFIIAGLYLIFQFETRYVLGILYSLISFFLSALFTVLNKKIAFNHHQNVIGFYEMLGGFIGITIYLLFSQNLTIESITIGAYDFMYLVILAVVCSSYAFSAIVRIMKEISAYVVILSINLEPVYGIIAAYFIFGSSEQMTMGFYIGAVIVILSVFSYNSMFKRFVKQNLNDVGQ